MRSLSIVIVYLLSSVSLAQVPIDLAVAKKYLLEQRPCDVAVATKHLIFPGTAQKPNVMGTVWCIATMTKGRGVNRESGCALVRYDLNEGRYVVGIHRPLLTDLYMVKGKTCTWPVVEKLLNQKPPYYAPYGAAKNALFLGAEAKYPAMILYNSFPEFNSWWAGNSGRTKSDWNKKK